MLYWIYSSVMAYFKMSNGTYKLQTAENDR